MTRKYYYAGSQRIAERENGSLRWLLGDHLGSTAYTVNGTTKTGEVRYHPFGTNRYTSGQTLTSFKFTGQREEAGLGLYFYGARWYDPALGRFVQADTVVPNPGDAQGFDRYAYVFNNPLRYHDPGGHEPCPSGNWGDCRPNLTRPETYRLARHYYDLGVSWTDLPGDAKAVLAAQGEQEGTYSDLGPGATVQTGWKDPATLAASLYGVGRLVLRLPGIFMGACADGDCTNEAQEVAASLPCNSFSSDTVVLTADGLEPIITLTVGDQVYAYNEATGQTGLYTVTATMAHLDPVIVTLVIDGETIHTTPAHPFYVNGKWVGAGQLHVGDSVRKKDGRVGHVDRVTVARHSQLMYNLTVDQAHTFFVGHGHWLVHNAGCKITISTVAEDWATKGAHIKVNGVELSVRPGVDGSIVFKSVFSSTDASDVARAIKDATSTLQNDPKFVQQLYNATKRGVEFLGQSGNPKWAAKSGELNFLLSALEKLGAK